MINMKGLELSECYFHEYGIPLIKEYFSAYYDMMAVGMVGEGSECFGFDDDISRDHDWGPGFCIWLPPATHQEIGSLLQKAYNELPDTFRGYRSHKTIQGSGRTGVFEITAFYQRFTGLPYVPETSDQWLRIPESYLAVATNGKVFMDNPGLFTAYRNELMGFYPEDVRRLKIASRATTIAKTGQYNYPRSIQRKEYVAAQHALMQFIQASISITFLLNKKYTPFYKWMHRSMKSLPVLGEEIYENIATLCASGPAEDANNKVLIVENICARIVNELHNQGLSQGESNFLLDHAPLIQAGIKDPDLREH